MTNYLHPSAQIGAGTQLGHNSVIHENVIIGTNCRIGSGVVIHPDSMIGNTVRIDDNTVIGKLPMKAALSAVTKEQTLTSCVIADDCMIGAMVVIYRGCILHSKVMVADMASLREDARFVDLIHRITRPAS